MGEFFIEKLLLINYFMHLDFNFSKYNYALFIYNLVLISFLSSEIIKVGKRKSMLVTF